MVLVVNVGTTNTWALSDTRARESGGRLPYVQEVREWIQSNGGQLFSGDKWLATIDSSNEWVQAGEWPLGHCSGEMMGVAGLGSTHEQCMGHKPSGPGEVGTVGRVCTCQDTVVAVLCKPGTYSSATQSGCSLCTAGTYSTGQGGSSREKCISCGSGTFSTAQGSRMVWGDGAGTARPIREAGHTEVSCEGEVGGGWESVHGLDEQGPVGDWRPRVAMRASHVR